MFSSGTWKDQKFVSAQSRPAGVCSEASAGVIMRPPWQSRARTLTACRAAGNGLALGPRVARDARGLDRLGRHFFAVVTEQSQRLHGTSPDGHGEARCLHICRVVGHALVVVVEMEDFGHQVDTASISEAALAIHSHSHRASPHNPTETHFS